MLKPFNKYNSGCRRHGDCLTEQNSVLFLNSIGWSQKSLFRANLFNGYKGVLGTIPPWWPPPSSANWVMSGTPLPTSNIVGKEVTFWVTGVPGVIPNAKDWRWKSGLLHVPVTNHKKLEKHAMLPFYKKLKIIKQITFSWPLIRSEYLSHFIWGYHQPIDRLLLID